MGGQGLRREAGLRSYGLTFKLGGGGGPAPAGIVAGTSPRDPLERTRVIGTSLDASAAASSGG